MILSDYFLNWEFKHFCQRPEVGARGYMCPKDVNLNLMDLILDKKQRVRDNQGPDVFSARGSQLRH
jgi:hypothetical protein